MGIARKVGVPWVADLRDPLVSDFDRHQTSSRQAAAMRRLEADIMHRSDCVMTTCPSLAQDLLQRYPHRSWKDVWSVTNGFDRDALRELRVSDDQSEKCHFVAAGSFYGRREISKIVEPLKDVLSRRPEWAGQVKLTIAGTVDVKQRREWQTNCPAWLNLTGYLKREEAVQLTADATCNIAVVPDCDHGRLSIPGKTFELIALPHHILALVPTDSDTQQIISQVGGGTCVPFEQTDRVSRAMEQIIEKHFAGRLKAKRHWPVIDRYDRRIIGERFAEVLNGVTADQESRTTEAADSPSVLDIVGAA
jgi:hypothetical protein